MGLEELINNEKEWRKALYCDVQEIRKELYAQGKAIAGLKIKAGVWGLIAGVIPVTIALIISYIR